MNQERSSAIINTATTSSLAITYDTDSIRMIASYFDEMSAYRGRREWTEILGAHFLLEPERDFGLKIQLSDNQQHFQLVCSFESACGRYAFWRLINHQAPDAEKNLMSSGYPQKSSPPKPSSISSLLSSSERKEGPWILAGGKAEPAHRKRKLTSRLLDLVFGEE